MNARSLNPLTRALAHCDVPCGIYDTGAMTTAAETAYKMTRLLLDLSPPVEGEAWAETLARQNAVCRYVAQKEEHAARCKEQILMIWTDFFKQEHLDRFPGLHEQVWKAAKLCSQVKREVDPGAAGLLVDAAAKIASLVDEIKG